MAIQPLFRFLIQNNATVLSIKIMGEYFLANVLDQVYVPHQIFLAVIFTGMLLGDLTVSLALIVFLQIEKGALITAK